MTSFSTSIDKPLLRERYGIKYSAILNLRPQTRNRGSRNLDLGYYGYRLQVQQAGLMGLEMGSTTGHGGKRERAGRKPHDPPVKARCVYLTDEQVKLLRTWGRGDVSAGLRWLIDMAELLVRR